MFTSLRWKLQPHLPRTWLHSEQSTSDYCHVVCESCVNIVYVFNSFIYFLGLYIFLAHQIPNCKKIMRNLGVASFYWLFCSTRDYVRTITSIVWIKIWMIDDYKRTWLPDRVEKKEKHFACCLCMLDLSRKETLLLLVPNFLNTTNIIDLRIKLYKKIVCKLFNSIKQQTNRANLNLFKAKSICQQTSASNANFPL